MATTSSLLLLALALGLSPRPSFASIDDSRCSGSDSSRHCLALKYVVYAEKPGGPVVSEAEARKNLATINRIWDKCRIAFEIEEYVELVPNQHDLPYGLRNFADLTKTRQALQDDRTLLVVTTGKWDRKGSLGKTGANAWTSMPGSTPYGAILESSVGEFAPIIAHELGHYLGLSHVKKNKDLMNAIIYRSSENLSEEQCNAARASITSYWSRMLR